MDTRPASKADFALAFQREWKRKKAEYEAETSEPYGFRTAARSIVARHPSPAAEGDTMQAARQADSWRKQLQRCWWGRFMPAEQTRIFIAEELGCDASVFGVVPEAPIRIASGGEMFADLMDAVDKAILDTRRAERKLEKLSSMLAELAA